MINRLTYKIFLLSEEGIRDGVRASGLGILYSSIYFLTAILINWKNRVINEDSAVSTLNFIDIKYHVPRIRGILNKHVRKYLSLYVSIIELLIYCIIEISLMLTFASKLIYFRKNIYF